MNERVEVVEVVEGVEGVEELLFIILHLKSFFIFK
jgi:hypothetical protein